MKFNKTLFYLCFTCFIYSCTTDGSHTADQNVDSTKPAKKVSKKETLTKTFVPKHLKKLPIVNVKPNQRVKSPFKVTFNSRGLWHAYEGEVGFVKAIDSDGNELGSAILHSTDGKWMTDGPAKFDSELKFKIKSSKSGKLVFSSNAGPGDGVEAGKSYSFEIPVLFE